MLFPKPNHKRKRPTQKKRGEISKEQRQLTYDWFGEACTICNGYPTDLHHLVFRSQQGRGVYRNLMPLCIPCHKRAHTERAFADELREMRQEAFGDHFFHDMYDLYDLGFIEEETEQAYEKFMRSEERK